MGMHDAVRFFRCVAFLCPLSAAPPQHQSLKSPPSAPSRGRIRPCKYLPQPRGHITALGTVPLPVLGTPWETLLSWAGCGWAWSLCRPPFARIPPQGVPKSPVLLTRENTKNEIWDGPRVFEGPVFRFPPSTRTAPGPPSMGVWGYQGLGRHLQINTAPAILELVVCTGVGGGAGGAGFGPSQSGPTGTPSRRRLDPARPL